MLKKVPIMPVFFFSTKCPFLTTTNTYSTFHVKSKGLGDFSPCSIMNRLKRRLLGQAPGNLPELSTAAGPLLLLVLGQLSIDSVLLLGPIVNDSI